MLAARLHPGASRLQLENVTVPEPRGDAILVRVAGCGVCRSDVHILDGEFRDQVRLPVTMGHEIAGRVAALGPHASGIELDEPVAVMVGWGCGYCFECVSGREQRCPNGDEAGSTRDGGFAEYVVVPHRRYVVGLEELDPVEATPLGCAALSAYAAVKRVRPFLAGGSTLVIIGAGGLGQHAIQLATALTGARVIAVDVRESALQRAAELGADQRVLAGGQAARAISELTKGGGAQAVIDFVGSDDSLALAVSAIARGGVLALLGLAGGAVRFGFLDVPPEAVLTTVVAGTIADLHEVVRMARSGQVRSKITRYPLPAIEEALTDLRAGRVEGRAVVTP